ncbi:MAG: hypothetical protein ACT4OK_11145 [Gemmobacter sp.]
MDEQSQIELEELFAKNHLMGRLRREFDVEGLEDFCQEHELPKNFVVDMMAHMALHRRAPMSTMVGILHHHFGDNMFELQACTDMIWKAAEAGVVNYDPIAWQFTMRFDVSDAVRLDLDRFQYPLPMVVPPQPIQSNRDTGYVTIRGSVILKGSTNHHEDDVCLDHLNRVNQIPLVINADTARLVQNQWKNLDRPKEGESQRDYEQRVRAFEKYDRVSREVIETLFMTGEPFYLTHRYDKRGRTYAQGYHVNTQGNAWNKAVIEFADQELVTGA